MSKETFSELWVPDLEHSMDQEPNVSVLKFGDGYETRMQNGINHDPEKWSLTFTKSDAVSAQILAFLRRQGATKAFLWKNPDGQTKTYVCRSWKRSKSRGYKTISVVFEQVFEA